MDPDSSTAGAQGNGAAATGVAKALAIIEGLGGATNILEIEPCITRLGAGCRRVRPGRRLRALIR